MGSLRAMGTAQMTLVWTLAEVLEGGEGEEEGGEEAGQDLIQWVEEEGVMVEDEVRTLLLKGKLGEFFLSAQSFYQTLTKRSLNRQSSPKSPEVVEKSGHRVQNSRNKNQTANSGQQLL